MQNIDSHRKGYALAAGFGAIGGGVLVAVVTRAVPKMMTSIMSGMMRNMMSQMKADGCEPEEM